MLDDIREWISDNLRYILLVFAGILLVVIAVLAIRLVTSLGSGKKTQTEAATENESETTPESEVQNDLVRNQEEVLDVVTRYYTARQNKDYDALSELCEVFNDNVKADYEKQDKPIESYNNIMTYSKAGLTEDSYSVFAYFDIKLTGIETLAPTLRGLYMVTDEDGSLIVSDPASHPDQKAYQEQIWTDDDVQALMRDVNSKLRDAMAQDEDLAAFVEEQNSTGSETGSDDDGEDGDTDDGTGNSEAIIGTMYATTEANVRGNPSTDGTLYWTLSTGMSVEVLENLDSGWSKIRFNTSGGTIIEGYVMTQYLTSQQ